MSPDALSAAPAWERLAPAAPHGVAWMADVRSFAQVKRATRLYQDPLWRRQNHFTKAQAADFLGKRHPQVAACSLSLEQLCRLFDHFPDQADWARRDFDPLRLWQDLEDPEQRQARRQATHAARAEARQECQRFVELLKDRLLLRIRGGAWHRVQDLTDLARELTGPGQAVQRFLASGGDKHTLPASQEVQGLSLLLNDALTLCRKEQLAELRGAAAGEREVRSTPRVDPRFETCPLIQDHLPRSPEEAHRLEELLLSEGCRDPLLVWESRKLLVDGHTRYAWCALLGKPYEVDYKEFASEQAACDYIEQLHYSRRNFNELQKSHVRGKQFLALKQSRGGDRRSSEAKCPTGTLKDKAAVLAQQYGVDRRTIFKDARFVRCLNRIVAVCGESLRQVILSDRIKGTSKSYIERLAKETHEEMQRLVKQAQKQGRWPFLTERGDRQKIIVSLPQGQPAKQATLLLAKLGLEDVLQLGKAIFKQARLGKRVRGVNGNDNHDRATGSAVSDKGVGLSVVK